MKIIVLHGDDYSKSIRRLQIFRDAAVGRGWDVYKVYDPGTNIAEIISGQGLFVRDKLIVVENTKLMTSVFGKWLNSNHKKYSSTLVIYSESKIPAAVVKMLPKGVVIEENKLSSKIWSLIDSFYPGNNRNFLRLLHETVSKEPIELVFSLLAKQIRDIYWVKVSELTYPQKGWKVAKLKSLASRFALKQLVGLINEFAVIDLKNKSSASNLVADLDFLVMSKLN